MIFIEKMFEADIRCAPVQCSVNSNFVRYFLEEHFCETDMDFESEVEKTTALVEDILETAFCKNNEISLYNALLQAIADPGEK